MRYLMLILVILATTWPPWPTLAQGPTPSPVPTLFPTPAPLSTGAMLPAMGVVMDATSSLSIQQVGMFLLALVLFGAVFEVLRIFLLKRSRL